MEIEGIKEFSKAIAEAKAEIRKLVEDEIRKSTFRVQSAAVKRIQRGPHTGRIYEKDNPRRTHQSSAPGQPPQSDTGRLAASIETQVDGLTGYVFTRVEYGSDLEMGTQKIAPRPWLLPSVEEDAPILRNALTGIIK
jgi:hypothetical protein